LTRDLRRQIGAEVDAAVRTLTGEWGAAWDDIAPAVSTAAADLTAAAAGLGRWPRPGEIMRIGSADTAIRGASAALGKLAERTETVTADGAERVAELDVEVESRIIASQAPDGEQPALARLVADRTVTEALQESARDNVRLMVMSRIRTDAINVITSRARTQIHSDTLPLAPAAVAAMRRELIRGVDVGDNPRVAAARMVTNLEGQFNGGLTRALVISRTEILDAYRATSQQIHTANRDVVKAWEWLSALDRRCCSSCWSMHGRRFPVETPGPDDHQQGRCARLPVLASWAELGINAPEPGSAMVSAEARFWTLPRSAQAQILGAGRLALLQSGRIGWADLAFRRFSPGWRPSVAPTPVAALRRLASRAPSTSTSTGPSPVPVAARLAAAITGPAARDAAPLSLVRRGSVTAAERRELLRYKGASYTAINGLLRSPGGLAAVATVAAYSQLTSAVQTIDTMMSRSVLSSDVLVDRGVQDGAGVFGDAWTRSMVGAQWTEHAYLSTTTNPNLAGLFASTSGGARLRILAPRGTGGVELSGQRHEGELLLQRGLRLRVVADTGPGISPRILTVEVVS
jgi:hypothetical protein